MAFTALSVVLTATLVLLAPSCARAATMEIAGADNAVRPPGVPAQVQLPSFDFDPKKWVQDAFGALLQDVSDGIRPGLDALWTANLITQTPPGLTY